ncbi:hypothetical protein HNR06_000422 [Nocardiopsis arvandica]|uniref:Tc1-like transposase DDE domain-containing protein n=1 Tax=Nocardiopsis sinuspersici TaxID=501010 RepID=A0A7Y9XA59_9ACTN|nr:hypothetical protein [Nocardiopsis sinuspersici]
MVEGSQTELSVASLRCYRHDRAPRMPYRTRPGWYRDRELFALVNEAHQELAAPILLVWNNLSGPRSGQTRRAIATRTWLEVEYLPAYAPKLDPTEGAWAHHLLLDAVEGASRLVAGDAGAVAQARSAPGAVAVGPTSGGGVGHPEAFGGLA